jgi:hypothetical protein
LAHELNDLIERLKPTAFVYNFRDEKPERIDRFLDVGATLKINDNYEILSFWFRWDHDWEGDGVEDWEPVTYVICGEKVIDIQTRTHWHIVRWMTDNPFLDGERAILYFSKHGHAPYMRVQSNIGWLKGAFDKTITGYAIPDFFEVMGEMSEYVQVSNYEVIENREPPSTSRAMRGVSILGKRFFADCYTKPKRT